MHMSDNTIITIGRQYGSAGKEIGYMIAERLGIKLYDQEMLKEASKESGLCEQFFEMHDEKPTHSFLYSLVMDTYAMNYSAGTYNEMPINHKVFLAQHDTIKKLADRESCILIGRCADYALENYPNAYKIFIYADLEEKIRRVSHKYDMTHAKAKEIILKTDKKRASYYNYYTSKKWGDSESYDLCINSSKLGMNETANTIIQYVNTRKSLQNPSIISRNKGV